MPGSALTVRSDDISSYSVYNVYMQYLIAFIDLNSCNIVIIKSCNYNLQTTALCKLVRALHTTKILSMLATSVSPLCLSKFTGIGPYKRVYLFFKRPIILSTWMRTIDSCLESSTSRCVSCFFPCMREGWYL